MIPLAALARGSVRPRPHLLSVLIENVKKNGCEGRTGQW